MNHETAQRIADQWKSARTRNDRTARAQAFTQFRDVALAGWSSAGNALYRNATGRRVRSVIGAIKSYVGE